TDYFSSDYEASYIKDNKDNIKMTNYNYFCYDLSAVIFSPEDLSRKTIFFTDYGNEDLDFFGYENSGIPEHETMTRELYTGLKKAILADILKQSFEEKYHSGSKSLGVISFAEKKSVFFGNYYDCFKIYITEDMTNTIEFLKSNNMIEFFNSDSDIVEAYIKPFDQAFISSQMNDKEYLSRYYRLFIGRVFESSFNSNKEYMEGYDFIEDKSFAEAYKLDDYNKISDSTTVEALRSKANSFCYIENGGYFCIFKNSNDEYFSTYIFEEDMPEEIKNAG
ncbi:MAG: hypothetical protein K5917_03550, partial [Clostridiales bacterium]|nr:hypothetical protein [Clostridiales bacterium]